MSMGTDTLAVFREGISDAAALIARETASARRAEADLARRARAYRAGRGIAAATASAKRGASEELARIPLVGFLFARRKAAEARAAETEFARIDAELASVVKEGRFVRSRIAELSSLSAGLGTAAEAARSLGHMPAGLQATAETAGNRAILLRRKVSPPTGDLVAAARDLISVATRWRTAREMAAKRLPPAAPVAANAPVSSSRIYLPIPVSMRHTAARAGALYDPKSPPGSRMYVPVGANLSPFERMLPLSFRAKAPKLTFPPIRSGAAGQSIWGMFDRETWDHVRSTAYERTGRRCMLCGKVSGSLRGRLFPEQQGRIGQVECHEVWDWKVPDPASGVGVQRLKALLVVCFECHAVFHEGFVTSAARRAGLLDQVEKFIETRRLLLTRMQPDELRDSLDRTDAAWRSHAGIDEWVVDLSHLAAQDFMSHAAPVLVEGNPAGLPPERVAGLSFVTDGGRSFPARPVAEVYAEATGPRDPAGSDRIPSIGNRRG